MPKTKQNSLGFVMKAKSSTIATYQRNSILIVQQSADNGPEKKERLKVRRLQSRVPPSRALEHSRAVRHRIAANIHHNKCCWDAFAYHNRKWASCNRPLELASKG